MQTQLNAGEGATTLGKTTGHPVLYSKHKGKTSYCQQRLKPVMHCLLIKCKPNSPSCKIDSAYHTSLSDIYLYLGINTVYVSLFFVVFLHNRSNSIPEDSGKKQQEKTNKT